MRPDITTTYAKAVRLAKKQLAADCNRERLRQKSLVIRHHSTQCVCGQTSAVEVYYIDFQKCAVVGYCKHCGETD